MTNDDFISAVETAEVANANPIETIEQDLILMERQIGRTRASVNLMSGATVAGDWAAGDCQALRRLVHALIDIADGATASVDRAVRQLVEMTANNRNLRDQLREALDDIDALRSDREVTQANYVHHTGELLAEITKLKAELGSVTTDATVGERLKELVSRNAQLRNLVDVEHRRADAAAAAMQEMTDRYATATETGGNDFRQKAIDATRAADQAFEEAKWKEGNRYLKLANTWIGLLATVPQSPETRPA